MDLKELEWEGVGWIYVVRDREHWQASANMVMTFQVS